VSSKNSPKAVKFDKGRQPLVLQCVPRPGVASQASSVPNERLQGKKRMDSACSVAQHLIGQQNRNHTNSTVLRKTNKLKFSPLPKGGRRFLPKTTSRKRRKFQFEHSKVLVRWKVLGKAFSATLSQPIRQTRYAQIYITSVKKFKWPTCQLSFSLAILVWSRSRVLGQFFVTKGSQSFASHRIHQAAFDLSHFASRGSRDSLINGVIACLRRPITKGSIRP
jgi:hypothetical protein